MNRVKGMPLFGKADHSLVYFEYDIKAAQSVTFELLILELMFLFFKNTVK